VRSGRSSSATWYGTALALGCALAIAAWGAPGAAAEPQDAAPARQGSSGPWRTHGLVIPASHPRLWFDPGRLAAARAWYRRHRFTPARRPGELVAVERALRGLLDGDAGMRREECRAALGWARETTTAMGAAASGGSGQWNAARWMGESIALVYDWCHSELGPAERAEFVERTNAWVEARRTMAYANVPMHLNNYYWGFLRNQVEWAIASYDDNVEAAERFLEDALVRRLEQDFHRGAAEQSRGGVLQEGSQYGPYVAGYATIPLVTAGLLGRDLLGETPFWKEAVYALVYATPPGATADLGWTFFPHCDAGRGLESSLVGPDVGNFMAAAAMRWRDAPVGAHARRWLELTGAPRSPHVAAVDPGGASRPLSELPLDYYAPGARWLFARTGWTPRDTAVFLQLGDRDVRHVGHAHVDWGSFQLWRGGRYLSRETATYLGDRRHAIAGPGGGPPVDGLTAAGHNTLLVEGQGSAASPARVMGEVQVLRLESRPAYAYAAADLSGTATRPRDGNRAIASWVREFLFLRGLETLVVLDRVATRDPGATRTFLAHCEEKPDVHGGAATCRVGDQALVLTVLLPAAPEYRLVREGGAVGQWRVEVDARPGAPDGLVLAVLQAKDARAPALSPRLTAAAGGGFVLALDAGTSIAFEGGMVSRGGAVTVGGAAIRLTEGVQDISVTEAGPAWRGSTP
jgi:hypothetical protein